MKNIVITGCSGGIGEATARFLVENHEVNVIGIARNGDKLNKISKQLNSAPAKGKFFPVPFDLTDIDSFSELKQIISVHAVELHGLINNAGAMVNKPFSSITPDNFGLAMRTNFKSPFFLIQTLLPLFAKPAHIVNIASMGGVQGSVKFPGLSVYSASKAALACLTECLAAEFAEDHIYVNAIAPGAVQTEMLAVAFPGYKASVTSGQMGEFIGYFALNGHKYFNGKILPASLSTP